MTDSAILRFNRNLLFEFETDGTPEGSIVTAPFSGTIPGGGPVLSFDSNVETPIPLIVDINPVQEGTGDPSPTNVRPINGWNNVNVYVSPTTDAEDGTTYSISLGQTVYGGTLDVLSGVLTITHAIVDLGTISWDTAGNRFISSNIRNLSVRKSNWSPSNPLPICSKYKYQAVLNGETTDFIFGIYDGYLYVRDLQYSTPSQFRDASAGVQVCYELATPTTVQLTPTEVKTLIGQNNIWSNSGDVYTSISTENVTYKITGGTEDVQRFNKIWESLLLYRNGGFTDKYRDLSGEGVGIILHDPAVLKEE